MFATQSLAGSAFASDTSAALRSPGRTTRGETRDARQAETFREAEGTHAP
jgi:hypothetical protein